MEQSNLEQSQSSEKDENIIAAIFCVIDESKPEGNQVLCELEGTDLELAVMYGEITTQIFSNVPKETIYGVLKYMSAEEDNRPIHSSCIVQ